MQLFTHKGKGYVFKFHLYGHTADYKSDGDKTNNIFGYLFVSVFIPDFVSIIPWLLMPGFVHFIIKFVSYDISYSTKSKKNLIYSI